MNEWQPMSTAKKDNQSILGYFPRSLCVFTMVWGKETGRWESFGGEGDFYGEQPICWMEVPYPDPNILGRLED
jgi:hypothetical protein